MSWAVNTLVLSWPDEEDGCVWVRCRCTEPGSAWSAWQCLEPMFTAWWSLPWPRPVMQERRWMWNLPGEPVWFDDDHEYMSSAIVQWGADPSRPDFWIFRKAGRAVYLPAPLVPDEVARQRTRRNHDVYRLWCEPVPFTQGRLTHWEADAEEATRACFDDLPESSRVCAGPTANVGGIGPEMDGRCGMVTIDHQSGKVVDARGSAIRTDACPARRAGQCKYLRHCLTHNAGTLIV